MKFWVDANISETLCSTITRLAAVDAQSLGSLGLNTARDVDLFRRFNGAGDVIVTKDEDFLDLVIRLGPPPQILLVTTGNGSNRSMRTVFERVFLSALQKLKAGEPIVEIGPRPDRGRSVFTPPAC